MPSRPTGTVTFLFTDIEGSTRHWEEHRAWMEHAFARQEQIIREAAAAHHGYVYKMVGDAFQIAFGDAADAVAAAVDAQRALQVEDWGDCGPLRVRMALHTGVAEERGDDYVGPSLNRVARLLSAGHGGQVLLSPGTFELVQDQLAQPIALRDLGVHRLKDIAHAEHIYQIAAPDLLADFPPLSTLEAVPHNLPAQMTSFVGRARERAEIKEHLKSARLLTLTGPGGTGKTRLAIQVAAELVPDYDDGVFFVGLAPIVDPSLVLPTIAQTLGLHESQGIKTSDQLKEYLRPKKILLLLDNFEQVQSAAPFVSDLLSAAPRLHILVTSRTLLHLSGEVNYPVPPFPLPEGRDLNMDRPAEAESLVLFAERARSVKPSFELNAENVNAVAQICTRLDGLPLAIELAAARIRLLPPLKLLAQLDKPLAFLTGGPRDLPARQQTLRGAIEWSYALLTENEKQLFRRMAVFVDGGTLDAIQAVCAECDGGQVLEGLSALADTSLVTEKDDDRKETRFAMLVTIRDYALELLRESDEYDEIQTRHSRFFGEFLNQREARLSGSGQTQTLAEIGAEIGNIRAGWDWAVDHLHVSEAAKYIEPLAEFYRINGRYGEGERAFARAGLRLSLEAENTAETEQELVHARILLHQGRFADSQGALDPARALMERALRTFRKLGARKETALALCCLGGSEGLYGAIAVYGETRPSPCSEALTIFQEIGDRRGIAFALMGLGWVALHAGDYVLARERFQASLDIARGLKEQETRVRALGALGYTCWILGNYADAQELHKEMLSLCQETGDRGGIARALGDLGIDACGMRDWERSRQLFQQSLDLYKEIGNAWGTCDELGDLAEVSLVMGDYADATRLAQESIDIQAKVMRHFHSWELRILGTAESRMGNLALAHKYLHAAFEQAIAVHMPSRLLHALVGTAVLFQAEGKQARALELLALTRHHHATWAWTKDCAARLADEIKVSLPTDVAAAAEARGRELDLQETTNQLLAELSGSSEHQELTDD